MGSSKTRKQIRERMDKHCPGDPEKCLFIYCSAHKECELHKSPREKIPNPHPGILHPKLNLYIDSILGQSVFEHELVKGNGSVIAKIHSCTSLKEINKVLEEAYNEKYRKPFSFSIKPASKKDPISFTRRYSEFLLFEKQVEKLPTKMIVHDYKKEAYIKLSDIKKIIKEIRSE